MGLGVYGSVFRVHGPGSRFHDLGIRVQLPGFRFQSLPRPLTLADLTAASINDEYSAGPFIRPSRTRGCFTMTNKIQS